MSDFKNEFGAKKGEEELPPVVFLTGPSQFKRWSETVNAIGMTILYTSWKRSMEVGGELFKILKELNPNNKGVLAMEGLKAPSAPTSLTTSSTSSTSTSTSSTSSTSTSSTSSTSTSTATTAS